MNDVELNLMLERLFEYDQFLGGNTKKEIQASNKNEFDTLKEIIRERMFTVKKTQDQRDEKIKKFGNDRENIEFGVKIRDELSELKRALQNMDDLLARQARNPKKYPKDQLQVHDQMYQKMKEFVEQLENRELGLNQGASELFNNDVRTVNEMKRDLMAQNGKQQQYKYDVSEEEEKAMQRFKENDKIMDVKLDQIIFGLDQLNDKANMLGGKIDITQNKMGKLNQEVSATNNTLVSQNARLKDLVLKFRQPHKFCLDITLILLLIGLIYVAVNLIKNK